MTSGKRARQRRRAAGVTRPRPVPGELETFRMKLPWGGFADITPPPPEVIGMTQRPDARTTPATPAELAALAEWLGRQPPEYQVYAAELMRTNLSLIEGSARLKESGLTGRRDIDARLLPVLARFWELVRSGELDMCRHVRALAPSPAVWQAWAPGKIRCQECARLESARIQDTKEDRRCDQCGTIQPRITSGMAETPAVPVRGVLVPVITLYGLCAHCVRAAERASSEQGE